MYPQADICEGDIFEAQESFMVLLVHVIHSARHGPSREP